MGKIHILELFHGPTLAFKDIALQFLSNFFEYALEERDQTMNVVGATSGDTGSAAIPSQTDINLAENWPDPLYVICSVADPSAPVVRAFALRGGEVQEASLDVVD